MNENTLNNFLDSLFKIFGENINISEYDIFPFASENIDDIVILLDDKLAINHLFSKNIIPLLCFKLNNSKKTYINNKNDRQISLITLAILLFIPDHRTAWNIRREFILLSYISTVNEFKLTQLILNKHPKSYEAIAQRSWLIRILEPQSFDSGKLKKLEDERSHILHMPCRDYTVLLANEMTLCTVVADKYWCNYALWDHRRFVFDKIISTLGRRDYIVFDNSDSKLQIKFLKEEMKSSYLFISIHISDSSAFSYRQFVINKYLDFLMMNHELSEIKLLLEMELMNNQQLIDFYTSYESLWSYRKFCLMKITRPAKELILNFNVDKLISEEIQWAQQMADISACNILPRKHLAWTRRFLLK